MANTFPFPRIIGHRGSAGTAPENTLLSFREAADCGVRAIEFDVVLSRDGVPVIFHDATLDRTTNGNGPIQEKTLAELKKLDAGNWKLPLFTGEQIPTLEETLKLARELSVMIDVELKPAPGQAEVTTVAAIEVIERWWPSDLPDPLLSSADTNCLTTALHLKPGWPRLHLFKGDHNDWLDRVGKTESSLVGFDTEQSRYAIASYIASGVPAYFYTVNNVKQAETLFRLGAAGIFTDYPAQMITQFGPLEALKHRQVEAGQTRLTSI